jgi:TetR/AcrR family transcriptional regulator
LTSTRRKGSVRAKRPQKRSEENRQRILAAAERIFAERGYSDTSIDSVAEAVDMYQPGIYYYFSSKQALYEEVVRNSIGSLDDRIKELMVSSDPPEERLLSSVGAWIDLLTERPSLGHLILHEASRPDASAIARILPEMGMRVQKLVSDAFSELGLEPSHDDVFHFASHTTGTAVFFVAALQPLWSGRKGVGASMERHKRLLLKGTRDLIQTMCDESSQRTAARRA